MLRHCLVLMLLPAATLLAADNKLPDSAKAILDKAESLELLSLEPTQAKDGFHGWKVLGKTAVKEADPKKQLVGAVQKGIADNKGMAAFCFIPRHGLRATHDGKTVDLVMCFECLQIKVYLDDKELPGVLTTASPQPLLDKVLKAAGVPLAKKP